MRAKLMALLLVLPLLAGLFAPPAVTARPIQVLGGLRVQHVLPSGAFEPLNPGDVTGLAVIMNPGIEKTMAQQLPPYMVPVFVDTQGGPNLDTLVALTNTLGVPITVRVTLHDQLGVEIGGRTLTLPALGTESFFVSTLVP